MPYDAAFCLFAVTAITWVEDCGFFKPKDFCSHCMVVPAFSIVSSVENDLLTIITRVVSGSRVLIVANISEPSAFEIKCILIDSCA